MSKCMSIIAQFKDAEIIIVITVCCQGAWPISRDEWFFSNLTIINSLQQQILEDQFPCSSELQSVTGPQHSECAGIPLLNRSCVSKSMIVYYYVVMHVHHEQLLLWTDSSSRHLDERTSQVSKPSVVGMSLMPQSNSVLNIGIVQVIKHNA